MNESMSRIIDDIFIIYNIKWLAMRIGRSVKMLGRWRNNHDTMSLDNISDLLAATGYELGFKCDICGDVHLINNVPLSCQTGDGE